MKGRKIVFHSIFGFMTMQAIKWPPWPKNENFQEKKVVHAFRRCHNTKPLFEIQ
jgi:hypothetical protein